MYYFNLSNTSDHTYKLLQFILQCTENNVIPIIRVY